MGESDRKGKKQDLTLMVYDPHGVSVLCSSTDISALAGFDYTVVSNVSLDWIDGETASKTCDVPIIADADVETDETFQLDIISPSGGAKLVTPNTLIATITNVASGIVKNDFNGDTVSDILWRNSATNQVYLWFMDGKTILPGSGYTATLDTATYNIAGNGDFDGDGNLDILLRHKIGGQMYIWFMNGNTTLASAYIAALDISTWTIANTGDFDGDGKADILLRNNVTGQVYFWFMDGNTILPASGYVANLDIRTWTVTDVADFNGDGNSDILWRNSATNQVYLWFMNGKTILAGSGYTATLDTATYKIAGTGDFDGDGNLDILLRHKIGGQMYIWLMNGNTILASAYIAALDISTWTIANTGDFDGDGKADILLRNNATGQVYFWFMDGNTILPASGYVANLDISTWSIQK